MPVYARVRACVDNDRLGGKTEMRKAEQLKKGAGSVAWFDALAAWLIICAGVFDGVEGRRAHGNLHTHTREGFSPCLNARSKAS